MRNADALISIGRPTSRYAHMSMCSCTSRPGYVCDKTRHGLLGHFCGWKMLVGKLCTPHLRAAGRGSTAEFAVVEM